MKSDGNRSRLRRIALFRFPVVTPYKGAKSKSSSTFSPRITRMTLATCRFKTSSLLIAHSSQEHSHALLSKGVGTRPSGPSNLLRLKLKHKVSGKSHRVALHRLVENLGGHAIENGQVLLKHYSLTANPVNRLRNLLDWNDLFAHSRQFRQITSSSAPQWN